MECECSNLAVEMSMFNATDTELNETQKRLTVYIDFGLEGVV